MTNPFKTVAVLGAGTMGAGIAQAAAQAGYHVQLYDLQEDYLQRGLSRIQQTLEKGLARGKVTEVEIAQINRLLQTTTRLEALQDADLVIEAVPEDLALKQELFVKLDAICQKPDTIFTSNTSSISITAIGGKCRRPKFIAGLHFFNPVAMMKLVEVIRGQCTAQSTLDQLTDFVRTLGKTPVLAKDTPGFIVNRVARPFYGEALKILGEQLADVETIDATMREQGGFRMGPFELMDLIGLDVNFAVTQSVYHAFFQEPRYRPHPIQQRMVAANLLGQKTGAGFYQYDGNLKQVTSHLSADANNDNTSSWTLERLAPHDIFMRILAMLVNEAASALMEDVATPVDIDTAMTLGTNYPQGPLAWADQLGLDVILQTLNDLHDTYREERYRPMRLLQHMVAQGYVGQRAGQGFYAYATR